VNQGSLPGAEQTSDIGQLLKALLVTLISVGTLLGSFLLAQLDIPRVPSTEPRAVAERSTLTPFLPTFTPQSSPAAPSEPSSPTSPPVEETAATQKEISSPTPALARTQIQPPPTACTRPAGWFIYTVQSADTLAGLARRSGTTIGTLMRKNCLATELLSEGQHIYVPPAFFATPTSEPYLCGPPLDWDIYIVQPGDTLYSLSGRFHVNVDALRRANCLRDHAIYVGQALYVPPLDPTPWPTRTATPTSTRYPSPTPTRPWTPTSTPVPTAMPTTARPTPTSMPSSTPTPRPTSPPSPTSATPLSTATETLTPTPSSASATPTTTMPSPTPTTPVPTETPLLTPTPSSASATPTTIMPSPTPTTPVPTETLVSTTAPAPTP